MSRTAQMTPVIRALIVYSSVAVVVIMVLACSMSPKSGSSIPVSPWGDNYFYSYDPPEQKPVASVPVTIAIVDPSFSKRVELDPLYSKVAKGFAKSLSVDLDKIIVAKGMTVTGPFESLDYMTYPDKKNADLSLTPEFFLNVQTRDTSGWQNVYYGRRVLEMTVDVKVDAWVTLMLREPMSSEKIWIKKIQVDEMSEMAKVLANRANRRTALDSSGAGNLVYDGRPDAVANIVKKMYPKIMNTVWRYLDTNELKVLKTKAREIRKLKRY